MSVSAASRGRIHGSKYTGAEGPDQRGCKSMRVATVCGTRPELIKLAPLVPLLVERFEHTYLFTGQHYSPSMVRVFIDELQAPGPDRYLGVGHSGLAPLTSATRGALAEVGPDLVLVYGDTNSTLAAGRAARDLGVPLLHLEAGIRSFDRSMPEERNRIEVDSIAALRLAPTGLAAWFLESVEGYMPAGNPVVGNLVVDALGQHRALAEERPLRGGLGAGGRPYALVTLHRQATVDDPVVFARLLAEFAQLDMDLYFPVHPRTEARREQFGLRWPDNLQAVAPVGYLDFLRAMSGAALLLTDSGGVQEEGFCLGVPCITLRPNTERMESVFLGANRLFDPATDSGLAAVAREAVESHRLRVKRSNPYGDGRAAQRVLALLERLAGDVPSFAFPRTEAFGGGTGFADDDALDAAAEHFRGVTG
jgi:UDP-N-acetylglucosamine 2-epimerase (non-hydrolysing)